MLFRVVQQITLLKGVAVNRPILLLMVVIAMIMDANIVSAQVVRGQPAFPVDTIRWPRQAGPLSIKEMARLKLHPVTLDTAVTMLNEYRLLNRMVLEKLRPGTVVLADSVGVIRYKADCGNLLAEIASCPLCTDGFGLLSPGNLLTSGGKNLDTSGANGRVATLSDQEGFGERFGKAFADALGMMGSFGGGIAGFLIGLLFIALMFLLLYLIWKGLRQVFGGSGNTTSARSLTSSQSTTTSTPTSAVPASAHFVPVVTPVSSPAAVATQEQSDSEGSAEKRTFRVRRRPGGEIIVDLPPGDVDVSVNI